MYLNQQNRLSRAILRPRIYQCPRRRRRINPSNEIEIVIIFTSA